MIALEKYHPTVLFLYYLLIISITVFYLHPFLLLFSFIASVLLYSRMTTLKEWIKDLTFYFVLFVLITLTNPLFVHKGETILFFLNGKPVTLEAIFYGMAIATMFLSIIFWSKIYSYLMTTDKVLYLFGTIFPKLALLLSMAFRFIPLFTQQVKRVHVTQKTLGFYTSDSLTDRLLNSFRVFMSVLRWSLEHAIEQADSMKARGYGLKGRTNYSNFSYSFKDYFGIALLFIMSLLLIYGTVKGAFYYFYYPRIYPLDQVMKEGMYWLVIVVLTIYPFAIEIKESLHWNYLKSKI